MAPGLTLLTLLIALLLPSMGALGRIGLPDVGHMMATKTRYAQRLPIPGAPSIYSTPDPQGYVAHHLWLLARHGTRWPTLDRMKQINSLAVTFKDARNYKDHPWMENWQAPTLNMTYAQGELHPIGEEELWGLARRLKRRFPSILRSPYLPGRYPIISTQVPRTAASASAFATGFFPYVPASDLKLEQQPLILPGSPETNGAGQDSGSQSLRNMLRALLPNSRDGRRGAGPLDVGAWLKGRLQQAQPQAGRQHDDDSKELRRPQAVAITMLPKDADPMLRFFDVCPAYAQREEYLEKWLASWLTDGWSELVPELEQRMGMTRPLNPCEVEALWTLCQYEAGLAGISHQACGLFNAADLRKLEWLDDVNLLESHGWGSPLNYKIAAPLLQDLRQTLQSVVKTPEHSPLQMHARLLFAHCETLVPLATLLGLFKPDAPPTPTAAQMPSSQELAAQAPVAEARRLLSEVDAVEDLTLRPPFTTPTPTAAGAGAGAAAGNGRPLQEGVDACVNGGPGPHVPLPDGWYPMTPFREERTFRGGRISPFGANMAVVLYKATSKHTRPAYRVRLVYNEQVVPIPGCKPLAAADNEDPSAALDCDLHDFLEVTRAAAGGADTLGAWCDPDTTGGVLQPHLETATHG